MMLHYYIAKIKQTLIFFELSILDCVKRLIFTLLPSTVPIM